jgi:hypothetical protein
MLFIQPVRGPLILLAGFEITSSTLIFRLFYLLIENLGKNYILLFSGINSNLNHSEKTLSPRFRCLHKHISMHVCKCDCEPSTGLITAIVILFEWWVLRG